MTNINNFIHPLKRLEAIADPEIRKQAIKNFDQSYYDENKQYDNNTVCDAIACMCEWGETPQGRDYWFSIYKLGLIRALAIIPEEPSKERSETAYNYSFANNSTGGRQIPTMEQVKNLRYIDTGRLVAENTQLKTENEKLRQFGSKVFNLYKTWCIDYPFVTDEFKELQKESEQLLNQDFKTE